MILYRRVLDNQSINSTDPIDLTQAFDVSVFRELHFILTVVSAGEGENAKIEVKHAHINEEKAYRSFATPVEADLTTTSDAWFAITSFTRFVYWFVTGTLSADAVIILDLVAKS